MCDLCGVITHFTFEVPLELEPGQHQLSLIDLINQGAVGVAFGPVESEEKADAPETAEKKRGLPALVELLEKFRAIQTAPPVLEPDPARELWNKLYGVTGTQGKSALWGKGSEPQKTYATLAAAYILSDLLPEWEEQFTRKNAEYGEYDSELGELGEAVEIWRKAKKLKRAFINNVDTTYWSETPREVAMDMIGHLFLLIMLLDEQGAGDESQE